jgi:hypothetical protein
MDTKPEANSIVQRVAEHLSGKAGTRVQDLTPEKLLDLRLAAGEGGRVLDKLIQDLLSETLVEWLQTGPLEVDKREYLYVTALSLGSLRNGLSRAVTLNNNQPFIKN